MADALQQQMTERVVEMIFRFADGDETVLDWLQSLGAKVESDTEKVWRVSSLIGKPEWVGLMMPMSVIDLAPCFGLIIAGIYYPHVLPTLQASVDKKFKQLQKQGKANEKSASRPQTRHRVASPEKQAELF